MYRILRNLTVHGRFHNNPPQYLILSRMNPIRIITLYFFKIKFNAVLCSHPQHSWSSRVMIRFSEQNVALISRFPHECYEINITFPHFIT
jgi:hypothetical protein